MVELNRMRELKRLMALEDEVHVNLPLPHTRGPRSRELSVAQERWSDALWNMALNIGASVPDEEETRSGLALSQRPVFICGAPRSGTTLLSNLLDGHPELITLPREGGYLNYTRPNLLRIEPAKRMEWYCRTWAVSLASSFIVPPAWLLGRTNEQRQPYVQFMCRLRGWIRALESHYSCPMRFAWLSALPLAYHDVRSGGAAQRLQRYWVEKTPGNECFLSQYWQAFPEAKVLHIVRDPRSVFASRLRIEKHVRSGPPPAHLVRRILIEIARSQRLAIQLEHTEPSHRYKVVRYEQLISDRHGTMNKIADFLDIEPHETLYRQTVGGGETMPNTSFVNESRQEMARDSSNMRLLMAFNAKNAAELGYEFPRYGAAECLLAKTGLWTRAFPARAKGVLKRTIRARFLTSNQVPLAV